MSDVETAGSGSSLTRRAIAILVLVVAGYIVLHVVIHAIIWLSTVVIVIAAVFALIWAIRTL